MHYILNSPPPTKIISSFHKIQIIGEWHDLTDEPQAFDAWCESPRGSLLFCLVSTSGWLGLLLDEGPHPLAYQHHNAVDILTSQSLFANYFTHYGSRCAQPHPVHSAAGIEINLNTQESLCECIKVKMKLNKKLPYHNYLLYILKMDLWKMERRYYEAIDFFYRLH